MRHLDVFIDFFISHSNAHLSCTRNDKRIDAQTDVQDVPVDGEQLIRRLVLLIYRACQCLLTKVTDAEELASTQLDFEKRLEVLFDATAILNLVGFAGHGSFRYCL